MRRLLVALLLLAWVAAPAHALLFSGTAGGGGSDPTVGVLPSANDVYANWQNAGLEGIGGIAGVDAGRAACTTAEAGETMPLAPSGVTPPASGDDAANINKAITNCPSGSIVTLAAGTFTLDQSEFIELDKGVTLRGSGACTNASSPYCPTVITVDNGVLPDWTISSTTGGLNCGKTTTSLVSCSLNPVIWMAPISGLFDYGWSGCDHIAVCNKGTLLAADAAQGQTTIQLASTAGFSAGMWVLIDEASGAVWDTDPITQWSNQVWGAPDALNSSPSPATGRVIWPKCSTGNCASGDLGSSQYPYQSGTAGCWYSNCDRPTAELHLIKSVGPGPCPGAACTITFDDPLTVAFRVGDGTAFTGTVSSGSTTLTVVSGTAPLVGTMVSGTGIPQGDYVASGTAPTFTLSIAASASETGEAMQWGVHAAAVYYPSHQLSTTPLPFLQKAGVENLSVERGSGGNILMLYCAECWVDGVETFNWASGGVDLLYTARSEINTIYDHDCNDCENNGTEYALALSNASTENLVTNSIIRLSGKGMVGRTGAANVISYNYQDDTYYMAASIGDYWVDTGVNGSHYASTHHFLFEGNWGDNCDNDFTHGNEVYHTYFRNDCTGLRTAFTDPSNGYAVSDAQGHCWQTGGTNPHACAPLRAAGVQAYDYWNAFVGNVLGVSGTTTGADNWTYSTQNFGGGQTGAIWLIGWNNISSADDDPNLTGAAGSYIFRHGNYDYFDDAIDDWTSGYSHTLPNSFYLSAAPAFFEDGTHCTYPWPWVTPTAGTPLPSPSGTGCTADSALPAKARFDAGTPFVQP